MWKRSSYCTSSNCVEVMEFPDRSILLRSSRHPDKALHFTEEEWKAFLEGAEAGEFSARAS